MLVPAVVKSKGLDESILPIGTDKNVLVMADFSGSMSSANISTKSDISCLQVCASLAFYCSNKINKTSSFYNKFLSFSKNPFLYSWNSETDFATEVRRVIDQGQRYAENTDIEKAFDLILNSANMFNLSQKQMPDFLLILSDMQFDSKNSVGDKDQFNSTVDSFKIKYEQLRYKLPIIIYWNLNAHSGSIECEQGKNCAMISGFSPSALQVVLSGNLKEISPLSIMYKTLEKYEITVP